MRLKKSGAGAQPAERGAALAVMPRDRGDKLNCKWERAPAPGGLQGELKVATFLPELGVQPTPDAQRRKVNFVS